DVTFANFFKWVRDTLRQKDPRAGVGMSGSQAAEAYGGYDWSRLAHTLDFIQNYTHQDTIAMQRSFDSRVPRAPWYGYMAQNPAMRRALWRCLLNGNYGGSYFVEGYMFMPDLTPTRSTRDAAEVVAEFQSGVATLLRHAQRQNDIAVHYSQPSIRGAFISGADALFRDNRHGWVTALEDLGFQYEFVSSAQLEAAGQPRAGGPSATGGLFGAGPQQVEASRIGRYRVLVMPYSVALSDKEAEAIRGFVRDGGLLLADAKVGLMNEHCRTRPKAALDDVFGVKRERVNALGPVRDGEAQFTAQLGGLKLDLAVAEPDLALAGGAALGQHGQAPLAVVNKFGKGMAVLLNHFLEGYPRQRDLRTELPLRGLVENALRLGDVQPAIRATADGEPRPRLYVVRYQNGDALYVAAQHDGADAKDTTARVTLPFPKQGFAYDVRQGKALGQMRSASAELAPGDVKLYALLPYEVKGLTARAPASVRPGEMVRYEVAVETGGGQAGQHVLRVKVLGPDGKPREHYGAKLVVAKG
ncbi:MAG: hypothetical protein FJ279_37985, partial [Planctomycetes bacterium]|nr:hypothetical protein [Planctomycetota bacterium]